MGDRPNPSRNVSLNVPFVGAKSYKILLEWIYRMDVDLEMVYLKNAYDISGKPTACLHLHGQTVVALGASAAEFCAQRAIPCFQLPHPSDKTDSQELSEQLVRCKRYIYGKRK